MTILVKRTNTEQKNSFQYNRWQDIFYPIRQE